MWPVTATVSERTRRRAGAPAGRRQERGPQVCLRTLAFGGSPVLSPPMGTGQVDYRADVVIAGGGLAGLVAAYDLISAGQKVLLPDKEKGDKRGGLGREPV